MIATDKVESILGRQRNGRWNRSPSAYLGMLRTARSLLTRDAWIQGAYAADRKGRPLLTARTNQAVKFCGLGACENVSHDYQQYYLLKQLLAAAGDLSPEELSKFNDSKDKDETPDIVYARVIGLYDVAIKSLAILVSE